MQQPTEPRMEFNFQHDTIVGVELHSVETLAEQLDEMGWETSITHLPETRALRIELDLKPGHEALSEDAIERIRGTLLQ